MVKTAAIDVKEQDLPGTLEGFLRSVLDLEDISAILAPRRLPMKNTVMPALMADPESLNDIDPLAPVFPLNAAKVVSRLTRKPMGGKIAAVLRPCEMRAFIELVKLKQGSADDVVLVGVDCLGAYKNTDYFRMVGDDGAAFTRRFIHDRLSVNPEPAGGPDISPACKACEHFVAEGADILIGTLGADIDRHLLIQARTPKGEDLFARLGLTEQEEPGQRKGAIASLKSQREGFRDRMFAQTEEATSSLEKLTTYLADCVNCYNCRVACPVCYCKECVFVTDVFNHEPSQYLKWAQRKGSIKMPTDTVFYHLTRLAHMSTACVGCGQCSNACPNEIPVMELFRTIARRTQDAFDYMAGRSVEEEPPLSVFRENEFNDVAGL